LSCHRGIAVFRPLENKPLGSKRLGDIQKTNDSALNTFKLFTFLIERAKVSSRSLVYGMRKPRHTREHDIKSGNYILELE
jgi:hypothetical protein